MIGQRATAQSGAFTNYRTSDWYTGSRLTSKLLRGHATFGVVFNNDPRVGYCWFLGARAHHLRGLLGWCLDGDH